MTDAALSAVDEEAYKKQLLSRQLYTVGAEAQKKYAACDVLVVGMTGLGLELVKSLVLSGVRSVTLLDDAPIEWADLSTLFYAGPDDVGKPRAATLLPKINELNRFVRVTVAPAAGNFDPATGLVSDALLRAHTIAVFVDKRTTRLVAQNERCRALGVKMVCCESRGVACSVFVDGGAGDFVVLDKNGEDTVLCVVADMLSDGTVYMSDDKKHELEIGDLVYFLGLPGLHGELLNSHPPQNARHQADVPPAASTATTATDAASNGMQLFRVKNVLSPYVIQIDVSVEWRGWVWWWAISAAAGSRWRRRVRRRVPADDQGPADDEVRLARDGGRVAQLLRDHRRRPQDVRRAVPA